MMVIVLSLLVNVPGVAQELPRAHAATTQAEEADVLIEIPAGSATKYEIDACTGTVRVDRFLSMPMGYPANYGYVPRTLAGDGDELDALVFTRLPLIPASRIRVRVIGVLRMIDGGEEDQKLIAVPVPSVDPTYAPIHTLADLNPLERARIEAFFRNYKDLPAGGPSVELRGFGDEREAGDLLREALDRGAREPRCGG
jgi:inorganic pyrophosphatase